MFTAPPAQALVGSNDNKMARERLQRSNFTIKDVHGTNPTAKTQNEANNQIRQGEWDKGQISYSGIVARPPDSINFGQARKYTTEAQETFVDKHVRKGGTASLKDKYMRNNIKFGTSPNKDNLMTVTQANERNLSKSVV